MSGYFTWSDHGKKILSYLILLAKPSCFVLTDGVPVHITFNLVSVEVVVQTNVSISQIVTNVVYFIHLHLECYHCFHFCIAFNSRYLKGDEIKWEHLFVEDNDRYCHHSHCFHLSGASIGSEETQSVCSMCHLLHNQCRLFATKWPP